MEVDFMQSVGNEAPEGGKLSEAKISPSLFDETKDAVQEESGFEMDTCVLRADEGNRLLMVGKTWPRSVPFERLQEGSEMNGDARLFPNKSASDLEENENATDTITPNSPEKAMVENRAEWKSEKQGTNTMTMGNGVHSQTPWVMQNRGEHRAADRGRRDSGSIGGRVPPMGNTHQVFDTRPKPKNWAARLNPSSSTMKLEYIEAIDSEHPEIIEIEEDQVDEKSWETSLIGYFLDADQAFGLVRAIARTLWGQDGLEKVMGNDKGFYIFKFRTVEAMDAIFERGP
ncbi:hypothetical protein U1Q18_033366 [Sarracenia purpurea var. burkii]